MCRSCWEEAGSPTDLPSTIGEFVDLYNELYASHPAGGPLHVVLDDWNVEGVISPDLDRDGGDDADDLCEQISALMNAMTVPERYAALAVADGLNPEQPGPAPHSPGHQQH